MGVDSTFSFHGVREAILQAGRQVKNMGDKKRTSIMVLPSGEIKKVLSEGNIRYEQHLLPENYRLDTHKWNNVLICEHLGLHEILPFLFLSIPMKYQENEFTALKLNLTQRKLQLGSITTAHWTRTLQNPSRFLILISSLSIY